MQHNLSNRIAAHCTASHHVHRTHNQHCPLNAHVLLLYCTCIADVLLVYLPCIALLLYRRHDDFYSVLEGKFGKDNNKLIAAAQCDAIDFIERVVQVRVRGCPDLI